MIPSASTPPHGSSSSSYAARCAVYTALTAHFPYLIPVDATLSAFAGFIHVHGHEYHVCIDHAATQCSVDWRARQLLSSSSASSAALTSNRPFNLSHRLHASATPCDFLLDLRDTLERQQQQQQQQQQPNYQQRHQLPTTAYYTALLEDLSAIGWRNVASLDERLLRHVVLSMSDPQGRVHELKVTLPTTYPHPQALTHMQVDVTLPESFRLPFASTSAQQQQQQQHPSSSTSLPLQTLHQRFKASVLTFQQLFDSLDDIDTHTNVLEPQYPTRRDMHRRIALSPGVPVASLYVVLDARDPVKAYPKCRLVGPDRVVAPLRKVLNQRMHLWDTTGDSLPRHNLEHVLDMTFPPRPDNKDCSAADGDDDDAVGGGQCGICYDQRRDECVSDVACEREGCNIMYHRLCLVEWLRGLPDTRDSFDTLTGKCVYCEHPISVSTKQTY